MKNMGRGLSKAFENDFFFFSIKPTIAMKSILLFRGMPSILKNTFKEYFVASAFYVHKNKTWRCTKKVLKQIQPGE